MNQKPVHLAQTFAEKLPVKCGKLPWEAERLSREVGLQGEVSDS